MIPDRYLEANQRYLSAALDELCMHLVHHLEQLEGKPAPDSPNTARDPAPADSPHTARDLAPDSPHAARATAPADLSNTARDPAAASAHATGDLGASPAIDPGAPPILEALAEQAGLSPFERDVLLLVAGAELSSAVAALCAKIHADPRRAAPSGALALAALPGGHMSAFAPDGPLRRHRLIEAARDEGPLRGLLRADERVVLHLIGLGSLDERLRPVCERLTGRGFLPPSRERSRQRLARVLAESSSVPVLSGPDTAGKRALFASACDALGAFPFVARAPDLPLSAEGRETLAALWDREALLGGAALLVEHGPGDSDEALRAALAFVGRLHGRAGLSTREPASLAGRATARFDVPLLVFSERRAVLEAEVGPLAEGQREAIERAAAQFHLSAEAAASVAAELAGQTGRDVNLGDALWAACRAQSRPRLDELAQRIEPCATLRDLVLPAHELSVLGELVAQAQNVATVYETWGFEAKSSRGLGISALFSGPSGTGKTMAAEAVAAALRLDLYRIDLSQVISKYIGETEKNLRRVFDAADESGCVLLFDEADALFGKRSEVKDSHDRYANIETGYLLQRMEAYRGIAVLTTNTRDALDEAFTRRIRFIVHFPFPDREMRRDIWRGIFPGRTPLCGLDPDLLAQLVISGGNIRNIAMNAAFLAAAHGSSVDMKHILAAARREYEKLERPLTEIDLTGVS